MVREYNGSTYETLFTFVSLRHLLVIKEACGVVNGVFDWGACHLKKHFVFLEFLAGQDCSVRHRGLK